jgi:hypothetical protein
LGDPASSAIKTRAGGGGLARRMQFVRRMPPTLRLVRPDESFAMEPQPIERSLPRWFWALAAGTVLLVTGVLLWSAATADTTALRSLPDEQRLAIYARTIENLRDTCDPAPPRSMRDFCHGQAALAAKFKECDADQRCQELVRRHLFPPRR